MSVQYLVTFFFCLIFSVVPLFARSSLETVKMLSNDDNEIVLSVSAAGEISSLSTKDNTFTKVATPTEGFVGQEGMPDLPAISRVFTFPSDGKLQLEVIQDEMVEIDVNHPIKSFSTNDKTDMNADYRIDGGSMFPENIVEVGDPQIFRGHRLFSVTIHPYQYDSENQKLIYHENLTISVKFEKSKNPAAAGSVSNTPARMTADTYRFLNAVAMNGPERDDHGASLPRGGYLIATTLNDRNEDVVESIEQLADWKRANGHQVEILYSVNSLLGGGRNFRENEIQDRYDEWDPPLEYACVIAAFIEQNRNTDVTYGCLDGNNDHVPEVAVTRLGINGQNDVEKVIGRALNYQQRPWMEEVDWFNTATAYAYNVGRSHVPSVDHTITWIAEAERRSGFPNVTWHSQDGGDNGTPLQWLSDGFSVNFERGMNRAQIPNFNRLDFNPMWISSGGGHVPTVVDRVWNVGTAGNLEGPSVMAGTGHNPQTIHCNVIIGGMARGLLIEKLPLGWARALALLMLDYSGVGGWIQFATEFRLMGEPGQRAWIGEPVIPEVAHKEFIVTGQNRFEVSVIDTETDESISNALVTLILPGEALLAHGSTDANGVCVLDITEELDEDVLLSVIKDGVLPYQEEIETRESHLFVRGFISELNDEENGNGDGVLNPGETVEISITAENLSDDEDSEEITAMLTSNSAWLTVDDDEFNIGSIDRGEQVEYEDGINITLDPSAPENAHLGLSIILSSGEANWISSLNILIEGANLNFSEIEDGIVFEPEMVDMNIVLSNDGSYASPPMTAELVSVSQWVQIINADAVFEEIDPGETGGFSGDALRINPSPLAPPGLMAPMMILIRANEEDVPDTIEFELQIDTPRQSGPNGPDEYGYICLDDTDEMWEQAPEYDWIEIDPNNRNRDYDGEEIPGNRREQHTAEVELPFEFQYYGEVYQHITISENGFLAMGAGLEDLKQYENFPLDNVINGSFGMIAPFWDDLRFSGDANIYTYYEDDEKFYIIQWQEMTYVHGGNRRLKYQVILFDPVN